ncbi:methyltransferase [Luteimonas sp. RD2P54]|uniref:Methyltransferase n=1 Tax=Luteimonas endophytica TaxID=3042023 RepID=A0ABT6J6X4_9GAMM|nr:methyltransferase [Luteimonas endophytica]MDH5822581.1 methyltransferase [Luteimonas endophytica]
MKRTLLAALLPALFAACAAESDPPAAATTPPPAAEAPVPAPDAAVDSAAELDRVLAGDWRTPEFAARDQYRHPKETLSFFGITPDMTVVEITPGGGWYAEILAPYLYENGTYVAAVVDPASQEEADSREYYARARDGLRERLGGEPEAVYGRATMVEFDPAAPRFGEPGTADAVLTFRNVHNWLGNDTANGMFQGFFEVLKPGGVLGVVEHRAEQELPKDDESGYVAEATVIALAESAGFRLVDRSDINANRDDTRDHPNGVWTLPPSNNHDEADAEKYAAIGESDRMTLRFVKPE